MNAWSGSSSDSSSSSSSINTLPIDTSSTHYASVALPRARFRTRAPPPSQSCSSLYGSGITRRHSRTHRECEQLESSVFKMRILFYVLTTACVLMLVLYVTFISIVIASWSEITNQPRSDVSPHGGFHGQSGSGNGGESVASDVCVQTEKVRQFEDMWKRQDKGRIRAFIATGDFVRRYNPGVSDVHCFGNLKWLLHVFGEINMAVRESLDYIGNKQEEINKTSQCCSSDDEDSLLSCITGNSTESRVVLAHFFLNISAEYNKNNKYKKVSALQWATSSSINRRVQVHLDSIREFIITLAGFYYVYSHVTFKQNVTVTHKVILKRKHRTKKLMTFDGWTRTVSSMQGMFELLPDDSLSVHASKEYLHLAQEYSTYFGAVLIRT